MRQCGGRARYVRGLRARCVRGGRPMRAWRAGLLRAWRVKMISSTCFPGSISESPKWPPDWMVLRRTRQRGGSASGSHHSVRRQLVDGVKHEQDGPVRSTLPAELRRERLRQQIRREHAAAGCGLLVRRAAVFGEGCVELEEDCAEVGGACGCADGVHRVEGSVPRSHVSDQACEEDALGSAQPLAHAGGRRAEERAAPCGLILKEGHQLRPVEPPLIRARSRLLSRVPDSEPGFASQNLGGIAYHILLVSLSN